MHFVEQVACVAEIADAQEVFEEAGQEAVLLGEAGGEEEGVDLFEVEWA